MVCEEEQVGSVESEMKNSAITEEEGVGENGKTKKAKFLEKTFKIVDDPKTDTIVSWSATRESFVVWDSHSFSERILPNYFRHRNLSSFIRQLHFYGFRKIDSDRYEFSNEGFQGGKKHLLKNIPCKHHKCTKLHQGSSNLMKPPGLEDQVDKLKKEHNSLKEEILKLKQQHEISHIKLTNFEERIRCAEAELNDNQMLHFLAEMVKMQTMVEPFEKEIKEKEEHDAIDTTVKRHRLLGTKQCPLSTPKAMDITPNVEHRHLGSEQLSTLQSELIELLSEMEITSKVVPQAPSPLEDELCNSMQDLRAIDSSENLHDASFGYDVMLEKLMGESSVVDGEVHVNDSSIYLDFEDFISKSSD